MVYYFPITQMKIAYNLRTLIVQYSNALDKPTIFEHLV